MNQCQPESNQYWQYIALLVNTTIIFSIMKLFLKNIEYYQSRLARMY